jgi:hypothetical protein
MVQASPRFRHDLTATAVEADGVAYIDVRDASTEVTFRFYDFEYELALQLNGQPVSAIVDWAVTVYGLELTPQGIDEFSVRLSELGFLEDFGAVEPPAEDLFEESPTMSGMVSRMVGEGALPARTDRSGGSASFSLARPAESPPPEMTASISDGAALIVATPAAATPVGALLITVGPQESLPGSALVVREITAEPPGSETLMGFAGRAVPQQSTALVMTEDRLNSETMMGFAAVGDIGGPAPDRGPERTSAPSVRAVAERRQPPSPDSVQMAPFQPDDAPQRRVMVEGARARRPQPRHRHERKGRGLTIVMWVLVAVAAAAGIGYYIWTQQQVDSRHVRTISPRPAAVYRWFAPLGVVVAGRMRALSFSSAGTVAEILPAGAPFAAGEIIAKLQGATAREAEVNHDRSRLSYYEQMRDSMKAAGNQPALRQAELKLAEKRTLLEQAEAGYDRLVIRGGERGEIAEVLVKAGAPIAANATAARVKAGALLGEFPLEAHDAEAVGHLGFCRVEVAVPPPAPAPGETRRGATPPAAPRYVDCKLGPVDAAGKKLEVELPPAGGLAVGQSLRLARARYDGVFPIPRTAVVRVGDTDRVYVAGHGGIAEPRAVTLADSDTGEALVSQGIDVGDQVIVNPPPDLNDGERIEIEN